MAEDYITSEELTNKDQVISVGENYIPNLENRMRATIYQLFGRPPDPTAEISDHELLSEAAFWSIGELVNNANKANNRWAVLRQALFQKVKKQNADVEEKKLYQEIDYAIEHNQSDMLNKYGLTKVDLTSSILKLIEMHKTNSFALSEKFGKKIDITLRLRNKGNQKILNINVINNSPITVVDKSRVEYNVDKIKEDLINASQNPYEAAVQLYDKMADHAGGGFGAGLRSIVLFLKEAYLPFKSEIIFTKLIQYRSAGNSTIFSIELPVPQPA